MVLIPEVIIQEYLDCVLTVIRDDYASVMGGSGDETETLMYKILGTVAIFNYELFEQAKTVILTGKDSPRYLKVYQSYNPDDTTYPSIYVTQPSETGGVVDSLGIGEGDEDDNPSDVATDFGRTFNRSFSATYNIVILSDNRNEIALIYHLLRSGLIAFQESMEVLGLQNIKFGAIDLQFPNRLPPGLFSKILTMSCFYDINVPTFDITPVIKKINLFLTVKEQLS